MVTLGMERDRRESVRRALGAGSLALLFAVLALASGSEAAAQSVAPHVLYVNSYHPGYAWSDRVQAGVFETLRGVYGEDLDLRVEYLDAKHHGLRRGSDLGAALRDLWRLKYEDVAFDAVLVSDQDAYEMVATVRDELFPGVPVVFCGVEAPGVLPPLTTGVLSSTDYGENLELILEALPSTRRIWVVTDTSTTGKINRRKMAEAGAPLADRASVLFFDDGEGVEPEALLARVGGLGEGDAVFFLDYFNEPGGAYVDLATFLPRLTAASPAPVFSHVDHYLDMGVTGGRMNSGLDQGRQAAALALRALNEEPFESLPVETEASYPTFRYDKLREHGIPVGRLPEDSRIVGKPSGFLESRGPLFLAGVGFIVLEMLLIVWLFRSLRAQQRLREEARQSESQYRSVVESIHDALYRLDADRRVAMISPAGVRMLGYDSAEELLGMPSNAFWAPGAQRDGIMAEMAERGAVTDYEVEILRKDGSTLHVATSSALIRDSEGRFAGVEGVFRDITERKRAEEALRAAERRYRQLVDNSQSLIYTIERDGTMTYVSPSWRVQLGYEPDEVVGRAFRPLVHPDDVPLCEATLRDTVSSGGVMPGVEYRVFHKDGSVRWHRSVLAPVFTDDGSVGFCVGNAVDITEWKQAEEALRESERHVASILRVAPTGIGVVRDRVIAEVNDRLCAMVGYSDGELLGRSARMLYPTAEEFERVGRVKYAEIAAQSTGTVETRWRRKDGVELDVLLSSTPLDPSDLSAGVTFTALDITERKRAEEALRQSQDRFAKAFRSSPAPMALSERETGRFLDINEVAAAMLGRGREELLGETSTDVGIWVDAEDRRRVVRKLEEEGVVENEMVEMRRKSGDTMHVLWSIASIDLDGREVMLSVFQDVTDRVRAEEALRESEDRFSKAFRLNPAPLVLTEIESGLFIDMNDRWLEMLGYTRDELIGRTSKEAAIWLDPTDRDRALAKLKRRGVLIDEPVTFVTKSGAAVRVLWSADIVSVAGRDVMLSLTQNVTERLRTEEEHALEFRRTQALLQLGQMTDASLKEITDFALESAVELTRSRIGYLAFTNEDESVLTMHSWSRSAMEECAVADKPVHYPLAETGLWGEAIRQRRAVITNDYSAPSPLVKGVPHGHVEVRRHMNVPVFDQNRIVAVAGVGNKEGEYTEADAQQLTLLMQGMWALVQRRRAAEELRAKTEELERYFSSSLDLLCIADTDGRFLRLNPEWERVLGYAVSELEGKRFLDLVHPDDVEATLAAIGQLADQKEVLSFENRYRCADGSYRWIEWRSKPMGSTIYAVARDTTEWRATEEALRRTQFAMDHAPDSILWVDENGGIAYANHTACASLGYTRDELQSMTVFEIDPDFPRSGWEEHVARMERERWMRFESVHRAKDGSLFPVEVTTNYLGFEGRFSACAFDRDITERKRAEEERARLQTQLADAQRMESIGRLAGGVAHDFNNMLGVILGHTEMALDRVGQSDPLHGSLLEVRKAAERSADLTRQLLAFARRQTVAPKVIDLNQTVEGMLGMLRRLIGEHIHLAWLPGANVGAVRVDPSQVDQVLANLCVNARDAIGDTGLISIETGVAHFARPQRGATAEIAAGDYAVLTVSDNGAGMDGETLASLFEPFFTTKELGQGTGLGLATVYGIVRQNEGSIDVESAPGEGATFRIYLPRFESGAQQEGDAGAFEPTGGGGETILLVEDEAAILHMTTTMLEMRGYAVLAAETPLAALQLARAHDGGIDLLITDVIMPEMNGRDLAKKLAEICPGIRPLYMSGYTANVIADHGVLDPGVSFLQKPFTTRDLAAKVREVLDA